MAGITRAIHLKSGFDYGPVDKFAPDAGVRIPAEQGGGVPAVPNAICFVDIRDGETHIFLIDDEARKKLISKLTGGVVMPDGVT